MTAGLWLAAVCCTAFPLGVYWPGELTYNSDPDRWTLIEERLADLQQHGVDIVWLTHLSVDDTRNFASRARAYGIDVVAAVGHLDGTHAEIRNNPLAGTQFQQDLLTWSPEPWPLAWGVGDEPSASEMLQMSAYVRRLRSAQPPQNLTFVVNNAGLDAAKAVAIDQRAVDCYPFTLPSAPGFPTTPWNAFRKVLRKNVELGGAVPWGIIQGFKVFDGYRRVTWEFPTPEQISWQAWAAVAEGNRGVFCFTYRGFPGWDALLDADDQPTAQWERLGDAYHDLAPLSAVWETLQFDPQGFAALQRSVPDSSFVSTFVDPAGGRYCAVVAGYETPGNWTGRLLLGPDVQKLRRVGAVADTPLRAVNGLLQADITLPAGQGALFALQTDPGDPPQTYVDDLLTDRYRLDSIAYANVVRTPDSLERAILSATINAPWPACHVDYDLDQLLGERTPTAVRVVTYDGWAQTPATQGVLLYGSNNRRSFTPLSTNQFEQATVFPYRYARLSISWSPASGSAYGYCSGFQFRQWQRRAP